MLNRYSDTHVNNRRFLSHDVLLTLLHHCHVIYIYSKNFFSYKEKQEKKKTQQMRSSQKCAVGGHFPIQNCFTARITASAIITTSYNITTI